MSDTIVIYHANCADGFTAAWVAWRKFGNSAEYVPASYGDAPPDVAGKDVYILDFPYPRDVLLAMKEMAKSLLVLDHHKSAQADLEGLEFAVFDMGRSGAGMAADYFSWRCPLVDYVEDRDLWRFSLPDSKAMNAAIGSYEFTFVDWDALSMEIRCMPHLVKSVGLVILRGIDKYVSQMKKEASTCILYEYDVPVVNAPYLHVSELLNELAQGYPFAAAWHQRADGMYVYSLRSNRVDFDVSKLAKIWGGGGHRSAAGFVSKELAHVRCAP